MNQEEKIIELLAEIKALKAENAEYKKQKAYGLVWENEKNKEKIVEDCKKKLPILERVKDKEIITDKTQPMNLMIEGDNYHALTCLNYTHRGKIDVIYIDPPYNTGKAKEWKFNDKYVDREDRFRHSKWLNMMEKRLRLAHNLLTDDGVIFISIDDNEQVNLKLLCDEIFEENNFVANIVWHKKDNASYLSSKIVTLKEYILFYQKSDNFIGTFDKEIDKTRGRELINISNNKGERTLNKNFVLFPSYMNQLVEKGKYGGEQFLIEIVENFEIKKGKPQNDIKMYGRFSWSQNKINEEIKRGGFIKIKTLSAFKPIFFKNYKDDEKKKPLIDIFSKKIDPRITTTHDSMKDIKNLFGSIANKLFEHTKPKNLIKLLCNSCCEKNDIILDFFAGSGTTGHAVMELNKEDGGDRQFILCTNNENNNGNGQGGIAEAVCYPRIQKAIQGYKKNGDGEWVAGLGGNLHYFKADENSFISVETLKKIDDKKRLELTLKAGELIAIRENIFDEKEHSKYYQIFEDDSKQVAIYFKEEQIKLNELMEKLDSKKEKIVYLFGWGKTLFTGDDLGYPDIIVKDIPEPIIRIYQEINR